MTLFIAVLIIISMTAACTQTGTENTVAPVQTKDDQATQPVATSETENELLTPAGTYPIVNETVTLDMFIKENPTYVEDYDTNGLTLYLEELMGIDLQFVVAPSDSATEKVNLLMTSGTYPSAFYMTIPEVEKYGVVEGMLSDLSQYIETQMPNLMKRIEQVPSIIGQITSTDGKIYSLPFYSVILQANYPHKMWVNTMWLERMDMEAPTSPSEFYDICKQFIEINPDGIALTGSDPINFLAGAFTYYPGGIGSEYGLRLNSDTIESSAVSEGYKDALKYMKTLYQEQLLYESTYTMDRSQLKALIASEGEPVLFFVSNWSGSYIDTTNEELYSHYYPIAPLTGPSGSQYVSFFPTSVNNAFVVTDHCEYPEVAVRFADYFYTNEGFATAEFGEEGIDWRWAQNGEVGYGGDPSVVKWIVAWGGQTMNKTWAGNAIRFYDEMIETIDPTIDILTPAGMALQLYKTTAELYAPYYQDTYQSLSKLTFTNSESEEMSSIAVEVENYIAQSKIDFITGARDIDTEWEAYTEALNNMGINTLITIYQTAYDRQYK